MEMIRNSLDLTGRYRIGDGSRDGWHTYLLSVEKKEACVAGRRGPSG